MSLYLFLSPRKDGAVEGEYRKVASGLTLPNVVKIPTLVSAHGALEARPFHRHKMGARTLTESAARYVYAATDNGPTAEKMLLTFLLQAWVFSNPDAKNARFDAEDYR